MQIALDHPASKVAWSRLSDASNWVGSSDVAGRVRSKIVAAALSANPVLIEAEAGSGRRLAAEMIHCLSPVSSPSTSKGFCTITAGSSPVAELIPHLETALRSPNGNGNSSELQTLYVSEVARSGLPNLNQVAERLGVPFPLRLIASIPPLPRAGGSGRPRTLPMTEFPGVITIQIPPLRERRMDISALALRFLTDACEQAGVGPYGISSRMIAAYHDYDWPGNVAELRAVIESAVSTAALARFRGRILPDSFCAISFNGDRTGRSLKEMMRDIERSILETTLHRVDGNQTHAARLLQVSTTTLHEKLKRHRLLRGHRHQIVRD